MQDISAQVIFGGIPATGKLPVTASMSFPYGTGFKTEAIRLKYTIPEELGIQRKDLSPIDTLIQGCITNRSVPWLRGLGSERRQGVLYEIFWLSHI